MLKRTDLGPVHTASILYKTGEKNLHFCESVHTELHKNAKNGGIRKRYQKWISTKTEVFENALDQYERTKTEVFENAVIFNNELHKTGAMGTHKNGYLWLHICYQADQCEGTKTDVFSSVFVQKRSNVNG